MKRNLSTVLFVFLFIAGPSVASAQLRSTGPVINGHHHFNASDIEEHKRFWVDTLGGVPGTFGTGTEIVMFPDAIIFMRDQAPTGAMIGSTVNHVGFSVPNIRQTIARVKRAGFRMVTNEEAPPGVLVQDDIGLVEGDGPVTGIAYVLGPDDIKIEVLEMRAQTEPIVSHHIHFFGEDAEEMRAWYMDVFGAAERGGNTNGIIGADLPGLGLNFSASPRPPAATEGRTLDHIGFEIDGLEAFTQRLEARGITLDVPYRNVPAAGLAIAFITDPWGTRIELTEGLDNLR
jgi:catechol 2,3-dioxygenase-like lactoylglutathione lyase family enzyme